MANQPKIFDRLRAASGSAGAQRSVYRWLVHHHDEFAAVIQRIDRPSWEVVAAELHAEGLAKKDGGPLTAAYVRHAWWKADKAFKGAGAQPTKTAAGSQAASALPPRVASTATAPAQPLPPADPFRHLSRPRDMPAEPSRPTTALDPMEGADEATSTVPTFAPAKLRS